MLLTPAGRGVLEPRAARQEADRGHRFRHSGAVSAVPRAGRDAACSRPRCSRSNAAPASSGRKAPPNEAARLRPAGSARHPRAQHLRLRRPGRWPKPPEPAATRRGGAAAAARARPPGDAAAVRGHVAAAGGSGVTPSARPSGRSPRSTSGQGKPLLYRQGMRVEDHERVGSSAKARVPARPTGTLLAVAVRQHRAPPAVAAAPATPPVGTPATAAAARSPRARRRRAASAKKS